MLWAPFQRMPLSIQGWKRMLLRVAGFGAGFAAVSALILGFGLWWLHRPAKPKPWNTTAITASFAQLSSEGENYTIVFVYTLQNNTDADYRIADVAYLMPVI